MTHKMSTTSTEEILTIVIDCAPMGPRPDMYLPGVISKSSLSVDDFDTVSKSFGCWTFKVHTDKTDEYIKYRDTFKDTITQLYNSGCIRYGEW